MYAKRWRASRLEIVMSGPTAWSAVADRYYKAATTLSSPEERRANYLRAWRLYYFAQWPVASFPGQKKRLMSRR